MEEEKVQEGTPGKVYVAGKKMLTVAEWSKDRLNAEVEALEDMAKKAETEEAKTKLVDLIERLKQRKTNVEEIEMAKTKNKTTNGAKATTPKKTVVKKEGPSRADVIEEALLKGLGSDEKVVDYVAKKLPQDDVKKIKAQLGAVLRDVEKHLGRWKGYRFVKGEYKITKD